MFSRLIPDMEHIKQFRNPLTEGEMELVKYLDRLLPRDLNSSDIKSLKDYAGWLIFVQPYLNGSRPDVVIFNPQIGIVIYEVKDWKLDNYSWGPGINGKNKLYVKSSKGNYPIKSPIKQVKYYKEKIIGQLVSQIGEKIDNNNKCFGLIKTAVYFHNATTEKAQELFGEEIDGNFKSFPIFGSDFLLEQNLNNIAPDINIISYFWEHQWNEELLFWLKPPFHSIEQGTNIKLNQSQQKITNLEKGHHRIRGVAGSGKTQVLAYRAAKAAASGLNVLVLCFNITLCHYIRDMLKRCPFNYDWRNITINYFHGFCKDIFNQFDVDWPDSGDFNNEYFFDTFIPDEIMKIVNNNKTDKFDVILVDEGQDFCYSWYLMLNSFLSDRDELFIVCDKKQNMYGRSLDWLDKRKNVLQKFGDWHDLRVTYRLPETIANVANAFSEKFNLNQEVKAVITDNNQLTFDLFSYGVKWINIFPEDWIDEINRAFDFIKSNTSAHPSDIVILVTDTIHGFECVKNFEEKNIKVNHVFEDDVESRWHKHKRAFWMGDSRLKISTVHSFKGWEVQYVILYIPEKGINRFELFDSLVYTAITRCGSTLIILNANNRYWKFGDTINRISNLPSKKIINK